MDNAISLHRECVLRTRNHATNWRDSLAVAGLGIAGEAGEVTDLIKKIVAHGRALDPAALADELGDVLWYVHEICYLSGLSLDAVLAGNVEKLRRRYPNGFVTGGGVRNVPSAG